MPQIPPREKLIGVNRNGVKERNSGMDNLFQGEREEKGKSRRYTNRKQAGIKRIKRPRSRR